MRDLLGEPIEPPEPRDPGKPQDGGNKWWPYDYIIAVLLMFGPIIGFLIAKVV